MPPKTQVNSATGIMAPSGAGKSSLLATLAKYVFKRWGKITLYYSSDGGGFPAEVQACIAAGIMRVFRMPTRDAGNLGLSFETCQRACQGWWPKRINPATGEVAPGVEMVPPVSIRFEMRCPEGHLVKSVPSESLLIPSACPTCKKMVTKLDMQVTKTVAPTRGFEQVGAVMYDGLSSMLAWEMRDLGHRAGRLEIKGEEGALGGKVSSGDLKFGSSNRAHYGFVQARGEELVHLTLGIPNLVVPPVFTMLTHEDVDERSLSIRGPKIMGRAKTDEAPQWFGNLLEAAKIPAITGSGEQRILYLEEFTDAQGIRHLCKHRGSPGTMPAYLIDPPEDKTHPELAFTGFNLGNFFEMLGVALETRIAQVMQEFPTAPGVPEGIVEIGDASIQAAPPQVVQTVAAAPVQPATVTTAAPAAAPQAPPATARVSQKRGVKPTATPPLQPAQPVTPVPAPPASQAPAAATLPLEDPPPVQSVEPVTTAPPAVPVATPQPAAPPVPGLTGQVVPRSGVAPPPGRRPMPAAALRPGPVTSAGQPSGTPAGASVNGPGAPRPATAAPRAPAAAPRPPAAASRGNGPVTPQ